MAVVSVREPVWWDTLVVGARGDRGALRCSGWVLLSYCLLLLDGLLCSRLFRLCRRWDKRGNWALVVSLVRLL